MGDTLRALIRNDALRLPVLGPLVGTLIVLIAIAIGTLSEAIGYRSEYNSLGIQNLFHALQSVDSDWRCSNSRGESDVLSIHAYSVLIFWLIFLGTTYSGFLAAVVWKRIRWNVLALEILALVVVAGLLNYYLGVGTCNQAMSNLDASDESFQRVFRYLIWSIPVFYLVGFGTGRVGSSQRSRSD